MKQLIGAAGMLALATAALAQDGGPPPGGPRTPPPPLTRAAVADMVAKRFAEIDANHDGAIDARELKAFEDRRQADRRAHRDREFAKLDKDGNGSLSRQEFDAPPPPPPGTPPAPGTMPSPGGAPNGPPPGDRHGGPHGPGGMMMIGMGPRWFEQADANHDGRVTLAEAQAAALARFDRMDANHDGTLTPDEMMKGMGWHGGGHRPGGPGGDMPPPPPPQ